MTLTDFLLARIAEDEAVARGFTGPRWVMAPDLPDAWPGLVEHVMRFRPARVLAECAAKRRIVALGQFSDSPESAVDFWLEEGKGRTPPKPLGTLIEIFRHLASVYADHPDYRPDWKP